MIDVKSVDGVSLEEESANASKEKCSCKLGLTRDENNETCRKCIAACKIREMLWKVALETANPELVETLLKAEFSRDKE